MKVIAITHILIFFCQSVGFDNESIEIREGLGKKMELQQNQEVCKLSTI